MTPGMRIVPHAVTRPFRCAMWPQLGARHPKGYFDVGTDDPEGWNHSYVSVEFVEQAALHLGWASPEQVKELQGLVADLERDKQVLQDEVADLNKDFEAIDLLASRGFTARKKPGRPRKEVEHG